MKKTLFVLFTAAMLFVTFACKQPANPEKYTGKGAQQNMAEPKTVTIPIDVVKSSDFLTRSIREDIVYRTKQAALAANIPQIETTDEAKINYVDWDLSVGRTAEEALSETLIVKHVTVKGLTPDSFANVKIDYDKIKQWFGREIQVGDEFWLGFRCSNQDGKELARMAHHIKVGNPTKLDKVELIYGFDGWYLEAALEGQYPTAMADFYLGADKKAVKINGDTPVNGHVVEVAPAVMGPPAVPAKYKTFFLCPVKDIVVNQPYHVKAHFKDVEFGGDEGVTSFMGEDVVYAKEGVDAWNFVLEGANDKKYALSSAKGRDKIAVNTADPVLTWNLMSTAAMLHKDKNNNSVLDREEYVIRVAEKEDLTDVSELVYKVENVMSGPNIIGKKANLAGLQFGKVYYAQVTYSYDIKKANSLERKEAKSPVVSFTTDDGLKSVLYTFDSGLKVNGTLEGGLPAAGFPTNNPASLSTNGTLDVTNGNSAPGLLLNNTNTLTSKAGKAYAKGVLAFDMQLPADIKTQIDLAGRYYLDKDGVPALGLAPVDRELMKITAEGTEIALVVVPTIVKSNKDAAGTAVGADWTIIPASVRLRAYAGDKYVYSNTAVLETTVTTTGTLTSVTPGVVSGYAYETVIKGAWLDYRKTEITFTKDKITGKFGDPVVEADVKEKLPMPKFNGYSSFTLTAVRDGFHVDNVKYTVEDANFKRHVY